MTYQFKIQIKGISKPPVWRKVEVPSSYTFWDFHAVIQVAFGWENAHLFKFSPNGYRSYPQIELQTEDGQDDFLGFERGKTLDAESTPLSAIFSKEGQKYTYIYDFGDSWEHLISLEKIIDRNILYPVCIQGKGACPTEDCGGIWGYQHLKQALGDPKHPEYKDMAEWMGFEDNEVWNPNEFNLDETKKLMVEVFSKQQK